MTAVDRTAARLVRARALKCAAVALTVGCLVFGLGGGAFAGLGLLAFAGVRRRQPLDAAGRLDAALGDTGAVRTAWDHRATDAPMARAQRARVEARLTDAVIRQAAPAPHWAWALSLGTVALPLLRPPTVDGPAVAPASAPISAAVASAGPSSASTDAATAAPQSDGPRAASARTSPSAAPDSVASDGNGGGGARAEIAGVGAKAGDRRARPVSARAVGLSDGTAAGLWLSDVSGTPLPEPPARVALAPPAGPPEDDIIDPARPYPRRYHALIARWFDR